MCLECNDLKVAGVYDNDGHPEYLNADISELKMLMISENSINKNAILQVRSHRTMKWPDMHVRRRSQRSHGEQVMIERERKQWTELKD